MAQFALANFGYTKPPSKIRQGINRNDLIIEDEGEAPGDGKYDRSQAINKEETDSK